MMGFKGKRMHVMNHLRPEISALVTSNGICGGELIWFCPDCDFLTKDKSKLVSSHLAIYHAYLDKFYYKDEEQITSPSKHDNQIEMEIDSTPNVNFEERDVVSSSQLECKVDNDSTEILANPSSNGQLEEMDTSISVEDPLKEEENMFDESPVIRRKFHETRILAPNWKFPLYECTKCKAIVPSLLDHYVCHIFLKEYTANKLEATRPWKFFTQKRFRYN